MRVLMHRCTKRSSLVRELVDSWQREHEEALRAGDIQELAGECLDLCRLYQETWTRLIQSLFHGDPDNIESTGKSFEQALNDALMVIRRVETLIQQTREQGFAVEGSQSLHHALSDLEALQKRIPKQWPFVDRAMVREARLDFEQGRFTDSGELVHALQGHRSPGD